MINFENPLIKLLIVFILWIIFSIISVMIKSFKKNKQNDENVRIFCENDCKCKDELITKINEKIKEIKNTPGKSVGYKQRKKSKIEMLKWVLKQI